MDNLNDKQYLHNITVHLMESLRQLDSAPGTTMHELPPDTQMKQVDRDEIEHYSQTEDGRDGPRLSSLYLDQYVQPDGELEDSADDNDGQKHTGEPDQYGHVRGTENSSAISTSTSISDNNKDTQEDFSTNSMDFKDDDEENSQFFDDSEESFASASNISNDTSFEPKLMNTNEDDDEDEPSDNSLNKT